MKVLPEGKLSNAFLKENIIDRINKDIHCNEIIIASNIGEDCAVLDFGTDYCVVSTDPITGAVHNVGEIAVDISCNDIASNGVRPFALLVTILAPVGSTDEQLIDVFTQINKRAEKLNVRIIGGHTEITSAVNRFVISTTAFGKATDEKMVVSSGANVGDDIIVTGNVATEGTYIIAHDKSDECAKFLTNDELEYISTFEDCLSVVEAGVLLRKSGVTAMHDITEGGVLGAAYEIAAASGLKCMIDLDAIPCLDVTRKICKHFNIDPYRLISSGSMIATAKDGMEICRILRDNGIACDVIGTITDCEESFIYNTDIHNKTVLQPPACDELFKI